MKKSLVVLLFIIIIVGGIFTGVAVMSSQNSKAVLSYSSTKTQKPLSTKIQQSSPTKPQSPTEIIGIPQHLAIPAIKVDANIEQVGLDPQRNMDVPKTDITVGWYKLGYKPGEKGSAVFDGHLDRADGSPAVFWKISDLKAGDKIITPDSNGYSYSFSVTRLVKYPYDGLPLNEVFGLSDKAKLNLITCNGAWSSTTKNYSHRLVVYSQRD